MVELYRYELVFGIVFRLLLTSLLGYLHSDAQFARVGANYRVEKICESSGTGRDVRPYVFCKSFSNDLPHSAFIAPT